MTVLTDTELQRVLEKEVIALINDHGLEIPKEGSETITDEETGEETTEKAISWTPYNVYRQEKPYKTDENDSEQDNYIILVINDEDGEKSSEDWIIEIQFIIGIELYEDEHQGHIIIADVMNQLWKHFRTHKIDGAELDTRDKAKRFNQENYPNYYEGALITKWHVRDVGVVSGTEEFL